MIVQTKHITVDGEETDYRFTSKSQYQKWVYQTLNPYMVYVHHSTIRDSSINYLITESKVQIEELVNPNSCISEHKNFIDAAYYLTELYKKNKGHDL